MLKHSSIQMELNFEGSGRNLFRERIRAGKFQVLNEIRVPSADTKLENAVSRNADFQYLTETSGTGILPCAALAVVGEQSDADMLDPVQFLASLCRDNPDAHLLYLSGRGRSPDQILGEVQHAKALGIKNFCAVSGATPKNADADTVARIPFLESVNILKRISALDRENIFPGATVNPFKYTAGDSTLQYLKMYKKVHFGASFLVSQSGWDMMKLQEFCWQTWRRNLNVPLFARMLFLTPDRAADICAGKYPGIAISPDLEAQLRHELHYSRQKFESAQIRRIQLHAAGAKLLGFHGIQLAGVDSPELFQTLLKCIGEALFEFQNFEDWRSAYLEHYSRMELAPYPYRFYLFENLLTQAQMPEEFQLHRSDMPDCPQSEIFRFKLAQMLFPKANELPPGERLLTKKLLLGCRLCSRCRVPETLFICPELCPKGMANGPCGCSRPDGACEFSSGECVFMKRLRIANMIRDFSMLETVCVEPLPKRPE